MRLFSLSTPKESLVKEDVTFVRVFRKKSAMQFTRMHCDMAHYVEKGDFTKELVETLNPGN